MEAKVKIEKKDFIRQSKVFEDHYLIDSQNILAQTETGYLTRCQHKTTKIVRAVKVIYKYMFSDLESFCNEVHKLKELVNFFLSKAVSTFIGSSKHPKIARILRRTEALLSGY